MYTEVAPEVADVVNNQRSMPSGHTSMAFALATSYWLSRRHLTNEDKPWMRWALMAGAAGVGGLRVAAGKHHPSDVLIGAGVGVGTAIVCHEIKF
jgi:membrane-associated phospholipid phosphatase